MDANFLPENEVMDIFLYFTALKKIDEKDGLQILDLQRELH